VLLNVMTGGAISHQANALATNQEPAGALEVLTVTNLTMLRAWLSNMSRAA